MSTAELKIFLKLCGVKAVVSPISLGNDFRVRSRFPQTRAYFQVTQTLAATLIRCHFYCLLAHLTSVCSLNTDPFHSTKALDSRLSLFQSALVFQQQPLPSSCSAINHRAHPIMDKFQNLPYRSKKRDRHDASDSALFLFPRQKRGNHDADRPQSNANPPSLPSDSAEAMTRSARLKEVFLSIKKLWRSSVTIVMSCLAVTRTPVTTVLATKTPTTMICSEED